MKNKFVDIINSIKCFFNIHETDIYYPNGTAARSTYRITYCKHCGKELEKEKIKKY